MTFYRRPRAFLSYRHEERRPGLFGNDYNRKHRAWIDQFAHALAKWNVDVIWDDRLRQLFRPHSKVPPEELPFLAEVSTLCLQSAQAFLPILTAGYAERIASGETGYGTVSEEWAHAVRECAAGGLEIATVVREWPIEGFAPPAEMRAGRAWDFRFVSPDKDEVEVFGDFLHMAWEVQRPASDMPFATLISVYLKFCVSEFGLLWPGVETWGCDFERPRIFTQLTRMPPSESGQGSARDFAEAGLASSGGAPFDAQAKEDKEMMANIFNTVAGHLQGFDFSDPAPGGRASSGLYFGPTVEKFSYLWKPPGT